MWDKRYWECVDSHQGYYTDSCMLESVQKDFRWCFSGVYGPRIDSERNILWEELAATRGLWNDHWVIGGDFNICRYEYERLNRTRRSRAVKNFSDIIEDLCLIDLPLQCAKFTWSRGDNSPQASRMDRFLISNDWSDIFKNVSQRALPDVISDHKPLILESGD